MKRWMIPFLAIAAIAVTAQNILFFTGNADTSSVEWDEDEEDYEDEEPDEEEPLRELPPVSAEEALAFVSGLPEPERARNPFLTRLEYDALSGGFLAERAAIADGTPKLDGTLTSNGRRVAWLDGASFSEGDRIRGFEILQIEATSVRLRDERREMRIEIEAAPAAPSSFEDDEYDEDADEAPESTEEGS